MYLRYAYIKANFDFDPDSTANPPRKKSPNPGIEEAVGG